MRSSQPEEATSKANMNNTLVFLRFPKVCDLTKLHKNSIYLKINPNSKYYCPDFPKPVKISARCVGFVEAEIHAWLESRMKERLNPKA
jgi:prophage regulatory protein